MAEISKSPLNLDDPFGAAAPSPNLPFDVAEAVERFHRAYYVSAERTIRNTFWLGVQVQKCPLDLWVYQEILFRTRPDVIVETGTAAGASAHFLACMCDLVGAGRVITVDVAEPPDPPSHPRLTYLTGSSTAPEIVARVRDSISPGERVMVALDSDHYKGHVLKEMELYAPLVTVGNYLIVEDTNVNGRPVAPRFGPGPAEAVEEFMATKDEFVVDGACEKFFMTLNPSGYLLRVRGDEPA